MDGGLKICLLLGFVTSTSALLLPTDTCDIGALTDKKTLITKKPVCCKFPFKYKGKVYNSCTLENSPGNYYWCSTNPIPNLDWGLGILDALKERCVDGGWSEWGIWSKWSRCRKSGKERRFRRRQCDSPVPDTSEGGRDCSEALNQRLYWWTQDNRESGKMGK